ncbi:DUF3592 domain-containing protein [Pseudocnuella soli]|uniref:DUF3592 domain-containing protein n=1 Tax=Pseudocnuella soli TaxID=2502779 RepID=UPI00104AA99D|nr:DUF3592 domain-containing protein [Pseudocnuella soli]
MEVAAMASIIIVALSAVPLLLVLVQWKRLRAFMRHSESTTATVQHCEQKRGLKGGVYYVTSLQYQTLHGAPQSVVHVGATRREKGSVIPLRYLPQQPQNYKVQFGRRVPLAILVSFLFFALVAVLCASLNGFL